MLPVLSRRVRCIQASALLLALSACRSDAPKPLWETLRARGTPTLEEIFLLPGIQGRAPRAEEISADGRWVVFHFNPIEISADGLRQISDEHSLRIQSTLSPESTDFEGLRLDDLLPRPPPSADPTDKPKEADLSFSHHGSRILARRDKDLFLLDAPADPRGAWTVRNLLHADPEGELKNLASARFDADDSSVLVESGKDLWQFPLRTDPALVWPLSAADGTNLTAAIDADASNLSFSRDLRVMFSRDPAIAKLAVAATEAVPATEIPAQILWRETGTAVALAGIADFPVVENTSLSPDGRFLFATVPDRSRDPEKTVIPDYLSSRVTTREGRRELAEDLPAPRKLVLWSTESGERTDLSLGTPDVIWLRTIGWAPQPDAASPPRLALARLSDDFRTLDTYLWSESTGLVKAMTDHDERWIGGPVDRARWSIDGARLIFGSESSAASSTPGHAQLFELDASTQAVRQLTQVSGEVSSFSQARDGGIVFSYSEAAASDQRRLGYIPKSGSVQELDAPVGFNANPQFADDSSLVIFTHSRMFQPAELWSLDPLSKQPAQRLSRTTPPDFAKRDWIHPALFQVAGARGAMVMSHVYLPRSSSLEHPDRPRAAIVFIHGAGYLQNVTDSMTEYEPNLLFHSRLAKLGYVVVDVDYRGSEGYGQDFRTAEQYHLGGLELDDIHATLDQLIARGVIDGKRVGCYGGSYGGFLTLMALFTAGDRWSAGAALRSVTDWRTYHPGYTQPRLGRPSTHADAYKRSSPIDHAEGLTKPLLLLHGMMDDNVFAQDTIRLMEKLIDLGKDFEVMLYPSQKHAFTDGAHWLDEYKRIERFLIEHVGPP